ncbi:4'-phosphopantetheinyl transferase superfamily protein [Paenibacillus albicereus]|uniref:4'-phosphopantetheinyl transferase superfamily protein n=1 Tax=Paenibacillus albicereus TaxID=2726185 RepID=A0A6H2GTK7_9BACL|nr:4'-phosphopantetheinyl transferase superfamily protein [Paenibacillus albicereus]QJC50763.1 4'-phosphopantetheinyl transferase superfamily protein [Paenibacillus albicereus]
MDRIAKLWLLPLDDAASREAAQGWPLLSADKQARLLRFRREEDRLRGLWAELLLRSVVCRELGWSNRDISFVFNAYGKPQLAGGSSFHFNVSHSGGWIACLADRQSVGVDVEAHAPVEPALAQACFCEEELAFLNVSSPGSEDWTRRFFRLWTAKESAVKALGKGLSVPLPSFSVLPALVGDGRVALEDGEYRLRELSVDPAYSLAACCSPESVWEGVEIADAESVLAEAGRR